MADDNHISISRAGLSQFVFQQCGNTNCNHKACDGKGFHCPLCAADVICRPKYCKIKEHFTTVHYERRVSDGDTDLLRCKLHCQFSTARAQKKFNGQPHYHCHLCRNGFPREAEIKRHLKTTHRISKVKYSNRNVTVDTESVDKEVGNIDQSNPACFSGAEYTAVEAGPDIVMQEMTESSTTACSLGTDSTDIDQLGPDIMMQEETTSSRNSTPNSLPAYSDLFNNQRPVINQDGEAAGVLHFQIPVTPSEGTCKKSSDLKVPCPHCCKLLHPNAVSQHVRTQHLMTPANTISSVRHLRGVCVDPGNGIFLIRKNFSGSDFVLHVQFKTSIPQTFICTSKQCNQLAETAARSNDTRFMCKHLKSVQHAHPMPNQAALDESALLDLIYSMKWLKPERREECISLQSAAAINQTPLIVCFPLSDTESKKYRHFSVFANDRQTKVNRVVVSCDTESLSFTGKCCGDGFCMHKNVAKWWIRQHEPILLSGMSTPLHASAASQQEATCTVYPPLDQDVAKKMTNYLYDYKRIPPDLPTELTVNYTQLKQFMRSYVPTETTCALCEAPLSSPMKCTDKAKLLTMSGLVKDVTLYIKICTACKVPYRYQEYVDGVHNFNDVWLVSLGVLDLIRQHLKVHDAIGRSIAAFESWLQLKPQTIPHNIIRNAYLHFESLTDHAYDFMCVLCGFYPPLLVMDVDKKGMFDLSVSELETPTRDDLESWDTVDADRFWREINLGIIYRGTARDGAKNP